MRWICFILTYLLVSCTEPDDSSGSGAHYYEPAVEPDPELGMFVDGLMREVEEGEWMKVLGRCHQSHFSGQIEQVKEPVGCYLAGVLGVWFVNNSIPKGEDEKLTLSDLNQIERIEPEAYRVAEYRPEDAQPFQYFKITGRVILKSGESRILNLAISRSKETGKLGISGAVG